MRYSLFLLIVLASVAFFNPAQIVSQPLHKALFMLAVGAGFLYGINDLSKMRDRSYPKVAYAVLMLGIAVSAVSCSAFHPQGLRVSFMATAPFLAAYFSFYVFMALDIPPEKIMKTYMWLALASTIVYFANLMHVPYNIFGEAMLENEDMSRGIVRLPVVFIEFFPMMVFYCINRWFDTGKKSWLWAIAWLGMMIVLSVIRQVIALTAVLGLMFIFRKLSWKMKLCMVAAVVAVVVWVLPLIPIYQAMIELSEDQRDANEETEDIRITAWRYYTVEGQTNDITPIIGNGIPSVGNSQWGTMYDSEIDDNKCFYVDVGWAGFFWLFGGIATAALIVVLLKALFKPKPESMQYLNYWLVFLILTSIASGPLVIFYQVVDITVCLYMVYSKADVKPSIAKNVNSTDNTQLQQSHRYPQLSKIG